MTTALRALVHTKEDERKELLELRSKALAGANRILDRMTREGDRRATWCEDEAVVAAGKRIRILDATLARLGANPPTKGRRGCTTAELREELRKNCLTKQALRYPDPKPQPAVPVNRRKAAIHEAAHAVAFEARGVRVLSVTLHECTPERSDVVGALCGAVAGRRAGYDDAHSPADIAMAKWVLRNEGKSGQQMPGAEAEAQRVVAARWPVILGVAAVLYERGKLTGDQVRGLMGRSAFEIQEQERYNRQHTDVQRMPRRFVW